MTTEERRRKIRRLLTDFLYYAESCQKVKTKSGEEKSFKPNRLQRRALAAMERQKKTTGKIRIVILKSRQQGFSTLAEKIVSQACSNTKLKTGVVVAHDRDTTETLFQMYHFTHKNLPDFMRPRTKYSNKRELVFEDLDTSIRVLNASSKELGRGYTPSFCHLSEVAFWPPATAADNFAALTSGVPDAPGTIIIVESTANGMTGKFYELWRDAVEGKNGYIAFFAPWYETEEYRAPLTDDLSKKSPYEQALVDDFGVDDEQLQWRRNKIGSIGIEKFEQEFPATPEEAFKASGRPVFPVEWVHEQLRKAGEPIERMDLDPLSNTIEPNLGGRLHVYRERDPKEVYTIGADVSAGYHHTGDYSVAQILDSQRRQVAIWRGQPQPIEFAAILQALGYYYNGALVAPESNNHGLVTAIELRRLGYYNIYTDVSEGKLSDDHTSNLGFRTTAKTRPIILGRLRDEMRNDTIEINDRTTLQEMLSFNANENGKVEAEPGCFDDTVMAMAIANYCLQTRWTPIDPEDFYVDPI